MRRNRISKEMGYLKIAEATLERSTCIRRQYGAIIVNHDEVVATGYNGSPRGETNCNEIGECEREILNVPKGERYELCKAVHAEQNAIISASRQQMMGGTIYIVGREVSTGEYANPVPCLICMRLIKNAGIVRVVGMTKDGIIEIDLKTKKTKSSKDTK